MIQVHLSYVRRDQLFQFYCSNINKQKRMGCGAMCGDSAVDSSSATNKSIITSKRILKKIGKHSPLIDKKQFEQFMTMYAVDPRRYHLSVRNHITTTDKVGDNILQRWKVILFGTDRQDKKYVSSLGLTEEEGNSYLPEDNKKMKNYTLMHHDCFQQIDKDLNRTFQLPEEKRKVFENVLKRIAIFFPKIGYTQGMNFIVAFLILVGYSQSDAFWIFVHISINKRCMLLGLYEDGFPLNNVFCILFKNILKRQHQQLYLHLFQLLMVDVSMWVFKWFMTCFVYSFPLEIGKYAFDILVNLGGLGMVALAVSITLELRDILLQKEDMAELSQFLKSLQEGHVFNHWVDFERVVSRVYQLQIVSQDFDGTELMGKMYAIYFKQNVQVFQCHLDKEQGLPKKNDVSSSSQTLLDQWYDTLLKERIQFLQMSRNTTVSEVQVPIESAEKEEDKGGIPNDGISLVVS